MFHFLDALTVRNLLLPLIFWLLLLNGGANVWAQKGDNLYASPGMPIMLSRQIPPAVAPAAKPWLTPPLPRFWHSPDSLVRQQQRWQFTQAVAQRIHYPKLALVSQLGGTVQVRVTVAPDGTPLTLVLVKSTLTIELPDKQAGEALQAEAVRVAQLLRFQPRSGAVDTVTFPVTYHYLL